MDKKKISFALQINSVAGYAQKDFATTMARAVDLGFQGVEFAGYYNLKPEFIRKVLDDCHLKAVGTHLVIQDLLADNFEKTVTFNKIIGNEHLIIGSGLGKINSTDAGNRMSANLVNELAWKAGKIGMFVGYHCHPDDFAMVGKTTAWDLFFSRTKENVLMQIDIANCINAGADPYQSMEKFSTRQKIVHIKAPGPDGTILGEGNDTADWARIFGFCENKAHSQWYILEQYPKKGIDNFDAVEASVKYLKKIGKI